MTVTIDKSAGFCWGVIRTIDIAESELAMREEGDRLHVLGEIIHNPMEIDRLEAKGLKTITLDRLEEARGQKVLIRAHGEPPATYERAALAGVELIDATCPVVWKVQERIRKFHDAGFQVVIYGKKDHAEVIGLVGQTERKAVVIKSVAEVDLVDVTRKTVLFSQTTMDKPTFYAIRDEMKKRIADLVVDSFEEMAVEFHAKDTICGQVFGRDKKLREYSSQNDLMIFVAGRSSSNGKVLYGICKDANPNTKFVENEAEILPEWLEGVGTVGISGATSTPQWLMERVALKVESIAAGSASSPAASATASASAVSPAPADSASSAAPATAPVRK